MFGLGWAEILIILIILLLVFGASRIPQLGESLGKGIKNFQKAVKGNSNKSEDDKQDSTENKSS